MTWPVLNLLGLHALVNGKPKDKGKGAKQGFVAELFFRHLRLSTYLVVTLVTYYWFFPLQRAAKWEVGVAIYPRSGYVGDTDVSAQF